MARPRAVAVVLACLALGGCISRWEDQQVAPRTVLETSDASDYRVTRMNGSRVLVHRPAIMGDSLVGALSPLPAWPDMPTQVAIALDDIRLVAVKQTDVVASAGAGIGITLLAFYVLVRIDGLPSGD